MLLYTHTHIDWGKSISKNTLSHIMHANVCVCVCGGLCVRAYVYKQSSRAKYKLNIKKRNVALRTGICGGSACIYVNIFIYINICTSLAEAAAGSRWITTKNSRTGGIGPETHTHTPPRQQALFFSFFLITNKGIARFGLVEGAGRAAVSQPPVKPLRRLGSVMRMRLTAAAH